MENRIDALISLLGDFAWPVIGLGILGVFIISIMKKANLFAKLKEWLRHLLYAGVALLYSLLASGVYLACIGEFAIVYFCICAAAIFIACLFAYSLGKAMSINSMLDKLFTLLLTKTTGTVHNIIYALYTVMGTMFAKETATDTPAEEVPAATENPSEGTSKGENSIEQKS